MDHPVITKELQHANKTEMDNRRLRFKMAHQRRSDIYVVFTEILAVVAFVFGKLQN